MNPNEERAMDELEALRRVRDEAYESWRELSKTHAGEEQEMAEELGEAIDKVDETIDRRAAPTPEDDRG